MIYPSYQEALLFAITEAIEALEDPLELGDVHMMLSIACDRAGKDADRLAIMKIAKKLSETQASSNKPLQYSGNFLTKAEEDVLKAVGELVDAVVDRRAKWVRNNPKERSIAAALEKVNKAVEALDESAKRKRKDNVSDQVGGDPQQENRWT